jgi:uncharacterized membrane protein
MNSLKSAFKGETAIPMLALTIASGVCVSLVAARVLWTRNLHYVFLVWNLFLAWVPLLFALVVCENFRNGSGRGWRLLGLVGTWLLFFPNAPYIFTDIVHLRRSYLPHFWVDLVLVLIAALTDLVLGFVSLYLMQSMVTKLVGRLASWLFILAVAGLSGIGIYIGRFLRLNSWDVIVRPLEIARGLRSVGAAPFAHLGSLALAGLFGTFLLVAYLMLYALTHLQPISAAGLAGTSAKLHES